jgi:hypothetical protein
VSSLPRYNNPRFAVGRFTNLEWWDAKYRQIYSIYLLKRYQDAIQSIEALQIQQRFMGGASYRKKFQELLEKCKKKK